MELRQKLEPAPRSYPNGVTLIRRASAETSVEGSTTLDAIESWLLHGAILSRDCLDLFPELVLRLVAAGLPIDRASLHVGTLHPQLYGFAWVWNRSDRLCDEIQVAESVLRSDAYRRNPLYRAIEFGETVRCRPTDPAVAERFPLMRELAAQGITDYLVEPIAGGAYHNAASVATQTPDGFSDPQLSLIKRAFALFALHVERHIAQRIAVNVLDTYLGAAASRQVLDGSIRRGSGGVVEAIIWVSDLRSFTDLIDRVDGKAMITLLNAYFEVLAGAVLEHGGEVLKFIGDGLLAVFPLEQSDKGAAAANSALAAARSALSGIERLNQAPPDELAVIPGWRPLRTGIALHEGEVFFGNVGAPARLDFTVIGRAVNAASRIEGLSKTLGRAILVTEPVARRLTETLEPLGDHSLRGFAAPVTIYGANPFAAREE